MIHFAIAHLLLAGRLCQRKMYELEPNDDATMLDTRVTLLLQLKSGGSERSWWEFFEKYRHYVLSLAVRQGLDEDQAHDVLQLVMMAVVRQAHGFQCDPATGSFRNTALHPEGEGHTFARFRSWLKGLVQVKIWEMRKFSARINPNATEESGESPQHEASDPSFQPDEAAAHHSEALFRRALMDQALLTLREGYRGSLRNVNIFESVALRGLTYSEAATTFAVTEVYARQIVHNLKSRLKNILLNLMQGSPN